MSVSRIIDFRCRPPIAAQKPLFDLKLGRLKWKNLFNCKPALATAMKRALSRARCSATVIPINGSSLAGGNSCARMGPTVARRSVGVSPCKRASVPLDLALSYMGQSYVLCYFFAKRSKGLLRR